ncbi:MAG: ATPase [Rhizobiales bacterium]|nr:ATPase [Hyphomicrobiales bacterium]
MAVDVTTPSACEIKVTRVFNAPAKLVFDCHIKPQLVPRWMLGPPGWSMPICEIDPKVGGSYRYVWRSESDGSEFGIHGKFLEIDAPTRIVHSEVMDGMPGEAVVTMTLVENAGRTTLTMLMRFPSQEIRDGALQSGMTDGMSASYERLEQVMSESG